MTRETIYSALFDKIKIAANFTTVSRRLRHWDDLQTEALPALFQVDGTETPSQTRGIPVKYELTAEIFIYVAVDDENTSPATLLHPLIDAVEATLTPDPSTGVQTLGVDGVSHCWISAPIEKYHGFLGNKGIAIIPINILTT